MDYNQTNTDLNGDNQNIVPQVDSNNGENNDLNQQSYQQPYAQQAYQQPYQQAYQQPYVQPYQQPYVQQSNGLATASLVCGIISWFAPYAGLLLSILSIIFGALGLKKSTKIGGVGKGQAITGMVLGIVGIAIGILLIRACVACVNGVNRSLY